MKSEFKELIISLFKKLDDNEFYGEVDEDYIEDKCSL
ncbi:unnamed protein product, partial [Rotaria socialis]